MSTRRTAVRALQTVLAGEHAAIYAYGVAGAQLRGLPRRRAQLAFTTHRVMRDRLEDLIRERDAEPVAASATYAVPHAVETADDATALATLVEERVAAVYADAVAELDGELRDLAVDNLRDAAVRAAQWRGGSVPFPGLPERAQ